MVCVFFLHLKKFLSTKKTCPGIKPGQENFLLGIQEKIGIKKRRAMYADCCIFFLGLEIFPPLFQEDHF